MPRFSRHLWIVLAVMFSTTLSRASDQPQWITVSSDHFSVLTDAGETRGRETVLRFEQMRAVFGQLLLRNKLFLSEPLDIIAFKSDDEYARVAPVQQGQLISPSGFFLHGDDRNFVILNLSEDASWRSVAHDYAHLMLNYNYPPTQGWFDEGFAEYFSSIRPVGKQIQLGADPEAYVPATDLIGNTTPVRNPPKALSDLLNQSVWMSLPDLFTTRHDTQSFREGTHHTMFYAESWIVVHYLIHKNLLSETGNYLQSVELDKIPVEQAIQKAYGMSAAQLLQAVKDYYKSIAVQSATPSPDPALGNAVMIQQIPAPVTADNFGASRRFLKLPEAQALVAEVQVRLPEHREAAVKQLQAIVATPDTENSIAHRALGWLAAQKNDADTANDELKKAIEIKPDDPWARYYLAVFRFRNAKFNGQYFEGMANMMQDLRMVIDWDPDFASAYNMLAMARLEGGGTQSAMEAMRAAIKLNPRNESYLLNLARIYMAGKKWDAATQLLKQLSGSADPQLSHSARKSLDDLPTLQKYGILPVDSDQEKAKADFAKERARLAPPTLPDEHEAEVKEPPPPEPDKRPVKYVKGRLLRVDCGAAPAAVVTVSVAGRSLKLRTENYKDLVLVGADEFSCSWTNMPVVVNYKAGGKADGDLVSLEVH